MYRSIFIDLDDTVWAFTENARDTFQDMYDKYHFDRYFRSFSHFYTLYSGKNEELWNEYDIIYKKKLMPHVREALEYLASSYNLYILSNGFRELQEQKMRSAGVEGYFKKIVLSEDIGVHKPFPEIFYFAMSATQSELHTSLMIGDNWKNDVEGAKNVGMGNVYYNIKGERGLPFKPGFDMRDWQDIASFL